MTQTPAATKAISPDAGPHALSGVGRWVAAVAVGSVLSAALGIVLSYVAFLMALLGLFFYLLFGLIVGALTYRVAAPARPQPRWSLAFGTVVIVLAGWGTSLAWEVHTFPHTIANNAIKEVPRLPVGMGKGAFREKVVADARSYINREYPPGGAIGYFRWMFTNGRFEKGVFEGVKAEMSLSQRGWTWLIRVVLSLLFMSCGVASQTLLLADRSQTVPPLSGRHILPKD